MARIPDSELERLKREVSVERLAEARGVKGRKPAPRSSLPSLAARLLAADEIAAGEVSRPAAPSTQGATSLALARR